jgi:hypothetical protein
MVEAEHRSTSRSAGHGYLWTGDFFAIGKMPVSDTLVI